MGEHVSIRMGDVLLFHGSGFISWGIRTFDGTDVNHAAIALDGTTLAEAASLGLRRQPIAAAVASNDYMRVRRHADPDLTAVVTIATKYLDRKVPYAYQQIVLLALLAATRPIPLGGFGRRMLRSILDHAAAALNAFIDGRDGNRSMICSEFVYRAFAEAPGDLAEQFRLRIKAGDIAYDSADSSFAERALGQPDAVYDEALRLPVSFAVTPLDATDEEAIEDDLAPLLVAWAMENDVDTSDMPPAPPPSFGPDDIEEPTDAELLASLIAFGTAYAGEEATSFGVSAAVGIAAARGAVQGLLKPGIEANFVTPGDLLNSPTLVDAGRVERPS